MEQPKNQYLKKITDTIMEPKVLILLVGLGIGYAMFKKLTKEPPGTDPYSNQTDIDKNKLTITLQQANNYAAQIFNAIRGIGTDESTIKSIFEKINSEDFKLIYNAFGTKKYNSFWGESPDYCIFCTGKDLVYILKSEVGKLVNPTLYNLIKTKVNAAGFTF